jgi:hypothetical protein
VRYFVYYKPDTADVRPHIIAEVVRETSDDGRFREWSVAASIAGNHCEILTRDELLQRPEGVRALVAWENLDDRQYDIDTRRHLDTIEREEASAGEPGPYLRLVPDEAVSAFAATDPHLQWLETRRRRLIVEAVRLRKEARTIITTAQARRHTSPSLNGSTAAEDTGGT